MKKKLIVTKLITTENKLSKSLGVENDIGKKGTEG